MRLFISLAAFVAMSGEAFAAPIIVPERDCDTCPKPAPKPPKKRDDPAPPTKPNDATPPVTVGPTPSEPVAGVTNNFTFVEVVNDEPEEDGLVRAGLSIAAAPGLWSVPPKVIDPDMHPMLPAFEGEFGGYVGIGGHHARAGYVQLAGAYHRGLIRSAGWGGGIDFGYTAVDDVIITLGADALVRDLDIEDQLRTARFVGGHGKLGVLGDLVDKDLLDVRVGGGVLVGGGTVRQEITNVVLLATDVVFKFELQIGLQ